MAEHKLEHDALEHILSYSYEHSQAAFVSNLPKSHKTETGKGPAKARFTASASAPETAVF